MAFKPDNMAYHEPMRGTGGLMVYMDQEDATGSGAGQMGSAGYFNDNGVRAFIRQQRDSVGTLANNGVPAILVGSDAMVMTTMRLNDSTGAVSITGTPFFLT